MPLVTSKEMLLKAQKGGYAVGAFNAENMEMVDVYKRQPPPLQVGEDVTGGVIKLLQIMF